ncbi:MAG TPA: hypothetical protein DHV22_07995 [Xanthomarina gelatinilytica]|uniref:DUF935 family protein n=1 Tax=Xanthomarina gelatinilytica TaxID=1137281 RepID=A0A3D6BTF1_9FLAO|nr:hypothetical protein [Xanthomarina gelatinilytica]
MGLRDTIKNYFKSEILQDLTVQEANILAAAKGASNAKSKHLEYEAETMQAQTLKEWKQAIAMATDPEEPNRQYLEKLYKNLLLDNHLSSIIDSRILYCQRSPFKIVNEKGDDNEELSYLFERTWFEDFIKYTLMSRFQGATLIELFEVNKETLELLEADEIPASYFNAKKGIIIKTPGDTTGWPYKEGALQPYYIQVGKNKDLGMLAQMAPIVLAKKLGMGSWLDYVEKYGVPPLFITTDREDDTYFNKLLNAAKNFKGNGFMVGRGNDKFEVGQVGNGNPDNFDKLAVRCNDEMSKRVLGGSGLTDEKAYVGSSEIQFRLAKDRFESDKLLLKNVINQQLLPRLQKIHTAYSGLNGHYFEWDNSETETREGIREMITTLAPHFELDPEEVSQKTGFTILGQKENSTIPGPGKEDPNKKKSVTGK